MVVHNLYETAGHDMLRVQQLLSHAYKDHGLQPENENERAIKVHQAIIFALRRFFEGTRSATPKGRPPNNLRIALECVLSA
eukprot:1883466-Pleurochrysis_carterae.AAC.1